MRRLLYTIVLLAVVLFGLSFAIRNPQTVELVYYFGLSWRAPLAVILAATLLAGFILGYLLSSLRALRARRELARLKRQASRQGQGNPAASSSRDMAVTT
jgi:putative membrane protein